MPDTDGKDESLRCQQLGMKHDRVRKCAEKFHICDPIREAESALSRCRLEKNMSKE